MPDTSTGPGQRYQLHPQLAAGTHKVAALALSDLLLMDDSNYPWLLLVPRVAGIRELIDLNGEQRQQLTGEIDLVSRLLRDIFHPFKLNVAALGNLVAQLHVHVIARFEHDPAWPGPVWGVVPARPYAPEALEQRLRQLRAVIGA